MIPVERNRAFLYGLTVIAIIQGLASPKAALAEQIVSFGLDVLPILQTHCGRCHTPGGEGYKASGVDLSNYAGVMKGTRHGKIVTPGDPLTSNLMVLVEGRSDPSIRMPHKQWPLLKQQIEIIGNWVRQGAQNN